MVPLEDLFSFYWPILLYGFDSKSRENVQKKTLFRGSSYKMPKVKNYFLINMYFIYRYSKLKKYGNAAIFQIRNVQLRSFVLSTYSDNSYRHFTPELRGEVLLLKLI